MPITGGQETGIYYTIGVTAHRNVECGNYSVETVETVETEV